MNTLRLSIPLVLGLTLAGCLGAGVGIQEHTRSEQRSTTCASTSHNDFGSTTFYPDTPLRPDERRWSYEGPSEGNHTLAITITLGRDWIYAQELHDPVTARLYDSADLLLAETILPDGGSIQQAYHVDDVTPGAVHAVLDGTGEVTYRIALDWSRCDALPAGA